MLINSLIKTLTRRRLTEMKLPDVDGKTTRTDIARLYARVFSTTDGRKVLDHLQRLTFLRTHGADAADSTLRHAEGQRALVHHILRLVATGREG